MFKAPAEVRRFLFTVSVLTLLYSPLAFAAVDKKTAPEKKSVVQHPTQVPLVGETIGEHEVLDTKKKRTSLSDLLAGNHTVLILMRSENFNQKMLAQSFHPVEKYLARLGYQTLFVVPEKSELKADILRPGGKAFLLFDHQDTLFKTFGIKTDAAPNARGDSALFIIGPDQVIRFNYLTASPSVMLSSELLLGAAKTFRDLFLRMQGPQGI